MTRPDAHYVCACGCDWRTPFNAAINRYEHPACCPGCGSLYFSWQNYEALFGKGTTSEEMVTP